MNELPEVIADVEEPEPAFEDSSRKVRQGPDSFPESPVGRASQTPSSNLGSETFSCPNGKTDVADFVLVYPFAHLAAVAPGMKNDCNVSLNGVENQSIGFVAIELPQRSRVHAYEVQGDILRRKLYESALEKKKSCTKSLHTEELQRKPLLFAYESPPNLTHQQQHQFSSDTGGKEQNQLTDIQKGEARNKSSETVELTRPSGDDQDRKVAHENPTCAEWHIIDPHDGEIMGPYSLSMLKQWNDIISCELKYKVCKTGQRQEDAIFLTDAIDQFDYDIGGKGQDQATAIKKREVKTKSSKMIELIELSDDDEDCKVANENPTCAVWHIVGPRGEIMGPYSLSVLKQWSDSSPHKLKSKVWKTGQSQKEAIFLSDAISQVFSNS
ncbi:hypothetical protein FNV43_RR18947 [Rhamnella rubrinervis]|uniref:GYF domain-containing protein n=1 Tax=Rhamnella rubrinervis TaxID=2594499 RepID=A0A8K0E4P9_9ROSA|nr:hypothetical protein FNV43_RR18947 [Rhamnella rubrinervis]